MGFILEVAMAGASRHASVEVGAESSERHFAEALEKLGFGASERLVHRRIDRLFDETTRSLGAVPHREDAG
ncbi:hypothetical protein GGR03_004679 [Aurantimonas endophytica]|uniref:Uncharacterized protein n=1 Tax=Aurantimonas endophytica TaxID=1522175 RepID=A0A7W6HII3_9HYPH|nr:hypothetical protein [Aurantimonas endophytica]